MFRKKSAWFSSSVPQACRDFWIMEGGTIAGCKTADYLFSEDATCPDTLRIFESKDYLWNKVVVFHSTFLSVCEKRQSVKSVFIGHYVLPPASVQDEVRDMVGRLIWESEDEQSVAQGSHHSLSWMEDKYSEGETGISDFEPRDTDTESEAPQCRHFLDYPINNMLTGYVSMEKLHKYSDDMCDVNPGCFQCSNCGAHCCLPHAYTKRITC